MPSPAYIDPGSGSLLLQIILGGVAAVGVTAKLTWRRLLHTLHIRRDEDETEASPEPPVS